MKKSAWKRITWWRYAFLAFCFLIIAVNPFLNYHWDINFVQGWFQSIGIGNLWVVSPLEGLESILTAKFFYMPSLVGMVVPVVVALLMGRVFCSWMCPIEFLSVVTDKFLGIFSKKLKYRKDLISLPHKILWFALTTELLLTMVIGYPMFVWWSPPGLVGREIMFYAFYKVITVEVWIVVVVLSLNLFTRRFFCRYFCPLGALLALIGKKRQLVIKYLPDKCINCKVCDTRCPMGIKPSIGESQTVYCWNCAECVDACPTKALKFIWRDDGVIRLKLHNELTTSSTAGKFSSTG
ncbi:4Fe-4S binding protein [Phorcysia thermohydrogeniphila]|uniref:Ferredoxin-type protein NapH n=1 Tax=Phorcysia thermohydrogeniphila TaxID=936138 RepID=A0A4R1G5Z6_9BACT|nr:4Fe-4S binding protein [Phorcysia thermohydrogeniphila]TCK03377.1 ferredoxin-type protein NapH [Phorcysia thermohydrogeniphila]